MAKEIKQQRILEYIGLTPRILCCEANPTLVSRECNKKIDGAKALIEGEAQYLKCSSLSATQRRTTYVRALRIGFTVRIRF